MSYMKEKFIMRANVSLNESNSSNSPYGSFSQYTRLNPITSPKMPTATSRKCSTTIP